MYQVYAFVRGEPSFHTLAESFNVTVAEYSPTADAERVPLTVIVLVSTPLNVTVFVSPFHSKSVAEIVGGVIFGWSPMLQCTTKTCRPPRSSSLNGEWDGSVM